MMRAVKPVHNLLTLSVDEINSAKLNDPPMILIGDALVFEANRSDFILEVYLSNGKEIVTQPQSDGESTIVAWRKGRAKLDYLESLNQHIVGMKITPLHQGGIPLLLRGVKIDRKGSYILELEKAHPVQAQRIPEPPMSYPPDPRVIAASLKMPSPFRHEPQTGFMASHIPAFSMQPMMLQAGGGITDGNHYKYTGKEFDAESGLYLMGARHYSFALGRFIQPDPLYIEMHRLIDPQQLNLYGYARNNPTSFSDPTGLDVTLKCEGGQGDCNTARDQLNGRDHAQFKVGLDKNNKLTAHVSKTEYSKLSKAEKALYNAINNTSNHATLNVVESTGQSEFGVHDSRGVNTVDLGNTAKLNAPGNSGGLNAGDVIAHEAMDAYFSLSMSAVVADNAAAALFPGLFQPTENQNQFNATHSQVLGATQYQGISDGRGGERITFQYITPIPAIDVDSRFNSPTRINDTTHDAGSRVTGATFEPKKDH